MDGGSSWDEVTAGASDGRGQVMAAGAKYWKWRQLGPAGFRNFGIHGLRVSADSMDLGIQGFGRFGDSGDSEIGGFRESGDSGIR